MKFELPNKILETRNLLIKHTLVLIFLVFSNTNVCSQESLSTEKVSKNPYYKTSMKIDNSVVTYYLSEFDRMKKLPLIVYIQGSGYHSLFSKKNGSIIPTSGHINLTYLSEGKAKVLIVEKPGVNYLDSMVPNKRNELFDKNFSLENWSKRIYNVLEHVLLKEKINTSKIMLIGHSEGGLVAARVAKLMEQRISNICIMAGEGPTQLYSLYSLANSGDFFNQISKNDKERTQYLMQSWHEIQKDSTNTEKLFLGFSYLRWHSFLKTSVMEELKNFKGSVLILQGTNDKHVFPESSKILYTSLISKGVKVKLGLIDNADHSFQIENSSHNGWKTTLKKSLDWFLADHN